ncbi:MAG: PEGA domain-containing protein [Candidatus Dojkabacteria bacterium]|nr:MAG: PEGA domain-containing protein [Candidatus Dojkabacteria bacterium]
MKFPKDAIKKLAKKVITVALPIFSGLFLIGTTIVILIIVNGYSIDISQKQLIKTGVLNLETNPSDAAITINNEYIGTTNRAIPNLTTGTYAINLSKDGYYSYKRTVDVRHGLATIIIAPLIKQTGAESVTSIGAIDKVFSNESGVYILSPSSSDATAITTQTPGTTVTPVPTAQSPAQQLYSITKYIVQRSFFEPPKPATRERAFIEVPQGWSIDDFTLSPTGKSILVTIANARGQKSASIVTFSTTKVEKIIPFSNVQLDIYIDEDDSILKWAKNSDYLLIESKSQVISYNIKTGARIILFDKLSRFDTFIWAMTDDGVIIVKNALDQNLPTPSPLPEGTHYSVEQISFNGNEIESDIKYVSLPTAPKEVSAVNLSDKTIIVLAGIDGSYLVGNMYDNRVGEYEITNATQKLGETPIISQGEGISMLKISDNFVDDVLFVTERFLVSYTSESKKDLYTFTYNKRAAEHYIELGKRELITNNEVPIESIKWIFNSHYLLFTSDRNMWAIDYIGSNLYQLQSGVANPSFYLEDSTFIYRGDDSNLYFKIIR